MKQALICSILAVTSVISKAADRIPDAFLSWYDGWSTHTVWGIGKVSGSYSDLHVMCGSSPVAIRAVYDTHTDTKPPTSIQTQEFARSRNIAVLKNLEANGRTCSFQLLPK